MAPSTPDLPFQFDLQGAGSLGGSPEPFQFDFSGAASMDRTYGFLPRLGEHSVNALHTVANGTAYLVDLVSHTSQGVGDMVTGGNFMEGWNRSHEEFQRAYGTGDPGFLDHLQGVSYALGLSHQRPADIYKDTGLTVGQLADVDMARRLGDDKIMSDTVGFLIQFATSPGAAAGKVGMEATKGTVGGIRALANATRQWAQKGMASNPGKFAELMREGQVLEAAMSKEGWRQIGEIASKLAQPTTRAGKWVDETAQMAGANAAQSYAMAAGDERMHQFQAAMVLAPFMLPIQQLANKLGSKIVSADPSKLGTAAQESLLRAAEMARKGDISVDGLANAYFKAQGAARQGAALGLSSAFEGTAFMALDPQARQLAFDFAAKGDFDAGEKLAKMWMATAAGVAFLKGKNLSHEQSLWFRQVRPDLNTLDTWIEAKANERVFEKAEQERIQQAEKAEKAEQKATQEAERATEAEAAAEERYGAESATNEANASLEQRLHDLEVQQAQADWGWATGDTLSALRGSWTPELLEFQGPVRPGKDRPKAGVRLRFGQDHSVTLRHEKGEPVLEVPSNVREVMAAFGRDPGDVVLKGDAARRVLDDLALIGMVQRSGSAINFERMGMQEVQPGEFAYPGDMRLHSANFDGQTVYRTAADTATYAKAENLKALGNNHLEPLTQHPNLETIALGVDQMATTQPDPLRDGVIRNAVHLARYSNSKAGQELRAFIESLPPEQLNAMLGRGDAMRSFLLDVGSMSANQKTAEAALTEASRAVTEMERPAPEQGPPTEQQMQADREVGNRLRSDTGEMQQPGADQWQMRTDGSKNRQRVREQGLEALEGVEGVRTLRTTPEQRDLLVDIVPKQRSSRYGDDVSLRRSLDRMDREISYVPSTADDLRIAMERWARKAESMVEAGELSQRQSDMIDGWFRSAMETYGVSVGGAEAGRPVKYLSLSQEIQLGLREPASMERRRRYAERGLEPGEVQMPGAEDPVPMRMTASEEAAARAKSSVKELRRQVAEQRELQQRQRQAEAEQNSRAPARALAEPSKEGLPKRPTEGDQPKVIDVGAGIPVKKIAGDVKRLAEMAAPGVKRVVRYLMEDPAVGLDKAGVEFGSRAMKVRAEQQREEAGALMIAAEAESLYKGKTKAQMQNAQNKETEMPGAPKSMTRTRAWDLIDGRIEPKNAAEAKLAEIGQRLNRTLRDKAADAGMLRTTLDPDGQPVEQPITKGGRSVTQYVAGRDRKLVFDNKKLLRAFFEDLAQANPEYMRDADTGEARLKTGEDLYREYVENFDPTKSKISARGGERESAVEFSRRFKNFPVHWEHNGKKYEMLETNPLAVMRVAAEQQTRRVAIAREFGVGSKNREAVLRQAQEEGWGEQYERALEKGGIEMHVDETLRGIDEALGNDVFQHDKVWHGVVHGLADRLQGREPTNYDLPGVSALRSAQGLRAASMASFSFVRDIPDMLRGAYLMSTRRFFSRGLGRLAKNWSEITQLAEREGLLQAQTMDWMMQESRGRGVELAKNWMGKLASWSEQLKTKIAVGTADLALSDIAKGRAVESDLTFFELANVSLADSAHLREVAAGGVKMDPKVRERALKKGVELLTSRTRKGEYSGFAENQVVSDLMVFQRFATKRMQQHAQIIGDTLRARSDYKALKKAGADPKEIAAARSKSVANAKRLMKSVLGVTMVGAVGDMLAEALVGLFTEGDGIEPIREFYNEATATPLATAKALLRSFSGQVVGGIASTFKRLTEDPTRAENWAGVTTPTAIVYAALTAGEAEGSAFVHLMDKSGLVPFARIQRGWMRAIDGESMGLRDLSSQVYKWRRDNNAMPAGGADKQRPEEFYDAIKQIKNTLHATGYDLEATLRQSQRHLRTALELAPEASVAASIRGHRLVSNLSLEQREDLFKQINDTDRVDRIIDFDNAMTDLAEVVGKMEGKRSTLDEFGTLLDLASQQAALGLSDEWRGLTSEAIDMTAAELLEGVRGGERLNMLARAYANYPEHLSKVFSGRELLVLESPRMGVNQRQRLIYTLLFRRSIQRMRSDVRDSLVEQR